jgi:hypothetical protein
MKNSNNSDVMKSYPEQKKHKDRLIFFCLADMAGSSRVRRFDATIILHNLFKILKHKLR